QHLALDLVAVIEVDEPAAAAILAASTARAEAPRPARPATARRGAVGTRTSRSARAALAIPLPAEIGAAEARAQLRHPLRIDLAIGPLEPFEHLRRKRRELRVGNRRRSLARLAAHALTQGSKPRRVERLGVAVADIRADFGPPFGVDGAVGIAQPFKH